MSGMNYNDLTAQQRLERAHVALMKHKATLAYGSVIMVGKSVIKDDVPTARTNYRDTFYGKDFVLSLPEPELNAVVLHENLHKAYQHRYLWANLWKESPQLANAAADFTINAEIKELEEKYPDFIKLPGGCCYDPSFAGMNTYQIFQELKKNAKIVYVSFDEHDADELAQQEQEALRVEIDIALRQGAIMAGKLDGERSDEFNRLLEPKVDWRAQMRDFVTEVSQGKDFSSWRKPNRRWVHQDLYLPSLFSERMGHVVIGVDTSGSIGGRELSLFLAETAGLCETMNPEIAHLLYWDTRVAGHETYGPEEYSNLREVTMPSGGGGTDVSCCFDYINKNLQDHPEVVIILTDGYTSYPDGGYKYPVLWVVTSDVIPPFGTTIRIT